MKKEVLSILGSTGSIGNNTVDVVSNNLNKFSVYGLTAKNNINLLLKQSHLVKPKAVAIQNKKKYKILKNELFGIPGYLITPTGVWKDLSPLVPKTPFPGGGDT